MPHRSHKNLWTALSVAALLALATTASSSDASTEAVALVWHQPVAGDAFNASESISRQIHYEMNSMLRALAAGRADPVTILEDRAQTIARDAGGACWLIKEDDSRRYGGDNPKDTSVVKRVSQIAVPIDASARSAPLPPLSGAPQIPQGPSPHAAAVEQSQCHAAAAAQDASRYKDAGDAALAEFPAGALVPGQKWSFSRPVRVERELASGTMTYTDKLVRVENRGSHRVAVIAVDGLGRIDLTKDLQDKGFKTTSMSFAGTAEFDVTDGLPLSQHYNGHALWAARIMGARVGIVVDETYDAKPWLLKPQR